MHTRPQRNIRPRFGIKSISTTIRVGVIAHIAPRRLSAAHPPFPPKRRIIAHLGSRVRRLLLPGTDMAPDARQGHAPNGHRAMAPAVGICLTTLTTSFGITVLTPRDSLARPVFTTMLICVVLMGWTMLFALLLKELHDAIHGLGQALPVGATLGFAAMTGQRGPGGPGGPGEQGGPGGPSGPGKPGATSRAGDRQGRPARTFWSALSAPERDVLGSIATPRTFHPGDPIFHEGDPADHVVIIRAGYAKVCVHENGVERIIAERGPGQLVGERAALEVRERSATVIALDTVDALILPTPDFAGFIGAHPHVLRIVERQVYDRLTENAWTNENSRPNAGRGEAPPPAVRPDLFDWHSCTIVTTDIVAYGGLHRTESDRQYIEVESAAMTHRAFVAAGISWADCLVTDLGDGLRIVVPPTVPTTQVIKALTLLYDELRRYDRRVRPNVQIKLRTSLHVGPVSYDGVRLVGEALIMAARLLDARPLRRRMNETGALLGVMASTYVYESFIKRLGPEDYEPVRCKVKEARLVAWMRVAGPALPPCP